ncbi:MAG: hypothetical protein A2508_09290 [Candidatus Lambdaproteobacteria bacterium RIFOXYD12_FULL_49_8]|nr:MAG: hypothetical protein A2508_09290 [Candidatus Lambdaproteobacteria bacterium RIFOXYD12_FULL_49_8]
MKFWFLGLALLLWLGGCSEKVGYQVGFVTREVNGLITLADASADTGPRPFVLATLHAATFLEQSDGKRLHQLRASLARPERGGRYLVRFDDEVDRVDLIFVAAGYIPARASFDRTLGVSAYSFDIELKKDPQWHKGYYIGLKAILADYITEPRYRLAPKDQLFLGQWMDQVETDLNHQGQ